MTADVRRSPRRGTPSACATKRMHSTQAREIVACASEDASFARSFDLCTSILTMHRVAQALRWWGGRESITEGQARVTENNLHWGFHERTERSSPRVTLDASRGRGTKEKEGDRGLRPCEDQEPLVWLLARRVQLQKSVGDVWPRISSATRSKKSGLCRVNGGLARSEGRRVKPSAGASSERYSRESDSPLRRERTGARPRVARDRHSAAFTSPKAVSGSWDRGCNGHRILRRVPADGRHPGSSRSVSFHEKAWTVISAVIASSSDPHYPTKRRTCGQAAASVKTEEARG